MRNITLENGDLIQAFPVHEKTLVGTFTLQNIEDYLVVHAEETLTLTVGFLSGTVQVNMIQGEDVTLGEGSLVVSTSGIARIS